MNIVIHYGLERLDLGVDANDERVIATWDGPASSETLDTATIAAALAHPTDFPPLAMAVVPGDKVAVALDLPSAAAVPIVAELSRIFAANDIGDFTVVSTSACPDHLPPGIIWKIHDPDDRGEIAYLATTKAGQRIYLDRTITDADFVLPIGLLGFDRSIGYSGPWSALYPGLSDRETQARFQALPSPDLSQIDAALPAGLAECSEVGWLIGCQLQVGVLLGGSSPIIAGLESVVRQVGIEVVNREWTFQVSEPADVVVVGLATRDQLASVADLGNALESATRLVRRGGKIVALTNLDGPLGPAFRRLAGVENPKAALNRLRGQEALADYVPAKQVATALAWADIYLHSRLDSDLVEDLAIIPLNRAEEAGKLARSALSLIAVNQAERTHCVVEAES